MSRRPTQRAALAARPVTPAYTRIGSDMTWPQPGAALNAVARALIYERPNRQNGLVAAAVIHAYTTMVLDPRDKRQRVVAALRTILRRAEAAR
jgi:hypothetical protein